MKGLTIRKITEATGGALHMKSACAADETRHEELPEGLREQLLDTEISSVTTDSRRAGAGALFGAIVGARVDGHDFIPAVFAQGALCVLCERDLTEEELYGAPSQDGDAAGGRPGAPVRIWIRVEDTVAALGRIAQLYLAGLNIPVVGITGSVGKTSTKEMIASVLSVRFRTLKTEGNFNNDLGLPLTIFRMTEEDEIAVLEMGISHFGDMERLAGIAQPDTCVITNIGNCHLEFLKDRDGVFREKTRMLDFVREHGHIVLNGNDDKLCNVQEVRGIRPLFFGIASEKLTDGVVARNIRSLGFAGSVCTLETPAGSIDVTVPVPGLHNVSNAAAAAAVGLSYGMTPEEIRKGIENAQTIAGRFHILEAGSRTVIDDCYNANPASMKASLSILKEVPGRRVAILGDMGELGTSEQALHAEVGTYAASCCDLLLAVGALSVHMAAAASEAAAPGPEVHHYETVAELLEQGSSLLQEGDTILVKASHFMKFDQIVQRLSEGV